MSNSSDLLADAIDWLQIEIERTPFGRLSIGVQTHGGQITKIFKSVEESKLASVAAEAQQVGNGRNG